MKIFFPIALDNVRSPISTLLREVAVRSPQFEFFGIKKGAHEDDRLCAAELEGLDHVSLVSNSVILTKRFDIVHHASASWNNFLCARFLKMRSLGRTRHLFTANCEAYETHPRRALLGKCASLADHTVAVSEAVSSSFDDVFGLELDGVIPNGFAGRDYLDCSSKRNPENTKVLFCSALLDRKQPRLVIALAKLMPHVDFLMVGSTFEDRLSQNILTEVEGLPNVVHLGRVGREECRHLMETSLVMIHPSDFEGLPLSVIEAMATGLPVIAQPKSSLPELIKDQENGFLLPLQDDLSDWVNTLNEILQWSSQKRIDFGATCSKSVERFTWEKVAEQYQALYQKFA